MSISTSTIDIAGLEGGHVSLSAEQLDDLASRLEGTMLREGDDGWDEAVLVWNGMVAKLPALVVQPTSAADVAAAVGFAREHGLLLGIKGGGHNLAGTSIAEDGVTLDLSRMRELTVDHAARLAHVGPGCRLQDVDRATQEHGLATVLGFVSEVGVAGLTLGGGLGYLARRFGWTVDNLEEVDIVTADGEIRTANRDLNADLFWALRGGGGNFGVVTRFTFRLHEVGPMVYGGLIAWPFERADEILRAYRTMTSEAPRELAVWMLLIHAPPAPFVPEEWHGRKICAMVVCYSGDLGDTDEALAPIRALGDPLVELLQEWPYTQQQSFLDETEPKGGHYYWKTDFVAELSDDLLTTTRELFAECPIPGGELGFLHLGGALNERDEDDGAIGNRDARYVHGVNGMWEPDEPDAELFQQWIRDAWARLRPFSTGRTYINFQSADEGDDRIQATYGANYERLAEIKRAYDPDNLFRSNRNILPATTDAPADGAPSSPEEWRRAIQEIARAIAPGWERQRARTEANVAPVREWMVRELAPQRGDTVLELAAGAGDTGFEALAAAGARGRLISTDFSPEMVDVARRRGAELGIRNVDYRVMDAERIDLDAGSVDGVLCRFGYMLMVDPGLALAQTRRVLRAGGRLALAVWGAPEKNAWLTILARLLVERGSVGPLDPEAPGPFRLAAEQRTRSLLGDAGFTTVHTEEVPVRFAARDVGDYLAYVGDTAGPVGLAVQGLTEAEGEALTTELAAAFAPFAVEGGGYELPGVALTAVAS